MQKHYETVTDERGNALVGYRARVKDASGNEVTIYADNGGTRFQDAAGNVVNEAITNELGRYEFYWEAVDGQTREILDPAGVMKDQLRDFFQYPALTEAGVKDLLPVYLISSFAGANDEAKLNAAVTTASTAGGGVIIIETDLDCDGLSFPNTRTNVTLRGADARTTIRLTSTAARGLFIQGANWRLENLTIEIDGFATTAGVEVRGNNFSADNVTFDFGAAVVSSVGLAFALAADGCNVTNCHFIGGELQFIAQTGAKNVTLENCTFTGAEHKCVVGRGNAAGGGYMTVTNCTFEENGADCQPMRFEKVTHDFPHVVVTNNRLTDGTKRAGGNEDSITFNGVTQFLCNSNYIDRAGDVGINASTGASFGNITGNTIVRSYNAAINLGQINADTVELAGPRSIGVLVSNNVFIDCGDRWDNPTTIAGSPYALLSCLRTTKCAFRGNIGVNTGTQTFAPLYGVTLGDNVDLVWKDNTLHGWTSAERWQRTTDSAIMGGGAINSTYWEVDGLWSSNPTMAAGAPAGSRIYNGGAKVWDGSAFVALGERTRRKCVTTDAGATPTFTTTGDIAGSRTGTGVYVYTFATALPADAIINVESNIGNGRTRTVIPAPDRLSITVYLWTTTTANDHDHTVTIG